MGMGKRCGNKMEGVKYWSDLGGRGGVVAGVGVSVGVVGRWAHWLRISCLDVCVCLLSQ